MKVNFTSKTRSGVARSQFQADHVPWCQRIWRTIDAILKTNTQSSRLKYWTPGARMISWVDSGLDRTGAGFARRFWHPKIYSVVLWLQSDMTISFRIFKMGNLSKIGWSLEERRKHRRWQCYRPRTELSILGAASFAYGSVLIITRKMKAGLHKRLHWQLFTFAFPFPTCNFSCFLIYLSHHRKSWSFKCFNTNGQCRPPMAMIAGVQSRFLSFGKQYITPSSTKSILISFSSRCNLAVFPVLSFSYFTPSRVSKDVLYLTVP